MISFFRIFTFIKQFYFKVFLFQFHNNFSIEAQPIRIFSVLLFALGAFITWFITFHIPTFTIFPYNFFIFVSIIVEVEQFFVGNHFLVLIFVIVIIL